MKLHLLLAFASTLLWTAFAQETVVPTENVSPRYAIATEGSTNTHRPNVDGSSGNAYIYLGGGFPSGTHLVDFQFLFDVANGAQTSSYITPILVEQTAPGIYTVRAIGVGHVVLEYPLPQTIPFTTVSGTRITLNTAYTFGFINALVDVIGIPVVKSEGGVDFDYTVDSGRGLGGPATTNAWGATNEPVSVSLGATFGAPGADFPFISPMRTYSAHASGVVVLQ
jgi:hypothetical protein